MNQIKKITNICESTGVKAATSLLNAHPQRFLAGFNLDFVGRINKYYGNKYYIDKNAQKVYDCIVIDYIIDKRYTYLFTKDSDEYNEFNEFLDANKISSISGIYNELKRKINE